jgi:hypothetical protein
MDPPARSSGRRGNLAAAIGRVDSPFAAAARGLYTGAMRMFFLVLGGIFALATLGTLIVGVGALGKGGAFNDKYGNKLMRLRVILQGLAIACFVLGIFSG